MGSTVFRRPALLALLLWGSTPAAVQGQYVKVTGSSVNVRQRPSVASTVVGTAEAGDIFQSVGEAEGWYAIRMFSGEDRYIQASLVEPTTVLPALPNSEETRRMVFEGFLRAEDRAFFEVEAGNPSGETSANLEYQQILDDRYKLQVSHAFPGIHPCHYGKIKTEGVEKKWDRIGSAAPSILEGDSSWPRL